MPNRAERVQEQPLVFERSPPRFDERVGERDVDQMRSSTGLFLAARVQHPRSTAPADHSKESVSSRKLFIRNVLE